MKVAELGSFSAVAKDQQLAKSLVSQRIANLEAQLKVRILNRTTRRVSLTEDGYNLLPIARTIAESMDDVLSYSEQRDTEPTGHIRITCPHDIGYLLMQSFLPSFLEKHPQISTELIFTSQYLNLIQDKLDLAIRASSQGFPDSSLVSKKVYTSRLRLYAAAKRFDARTAKQVEDLLDLPIILPPDGELRHYPVGGKARKLKTGKARVFCNDMYAAMIAAKAGQGIALLPEFLAMPELEAGTLQPILAEHDFGQGVFFIVYPSRRQLARKTRVFTEELASFLADLDQGLLR